MVATEPPPPPIDRAEWTVERLVAGGEGLARLRDGRIGFAARVACGDHIEPIALEHRRGVWRARSWRLLGAGPGRVAPACPWAERCGGCDWMHLSRGAQLEGKRAIVADALGRIAGRRDALELPPVRALGDAWRYRSRLRVHADRQGRVGLYGQASRTIVEVDDCPVAAEPIRHALAVLRGALAEPSRGRREPLDAEIRVAPAGPPVVVLLSPRRGHRPAPVLLRRLERRFPVYVAGDAVPLGGEQRYPLPGPVELWAPATAFTQVNWAVNVGLVQAVVARATACGARTFLDLYCGAGNFTLPLLAAGLRGVAIDLSDDAVAAARRAAQAQGLDACRFERGDVPSWLARLGNAERFDLALVDPPRAGAPDVAPFIAAIRPRACALCACDPATAARDIASLERVGYRLVSLEAFDMFPQTHHVELFAWLEQSAGAVRSLAPARP